MSRSFAMKNVHLIPLILVSLFVGWGMHYEIYYPHINFSDGTFHLSVLKYLDSAFKDGRNPFDFWYSGTPFGFALFRSYQYFPYIFIYIGHLLSFKTIDLAHMMAISNVLLVAALPWAFYFGLRIAGVSKSHAVFSSVISVLIADGGEFGYGLQNYTFGTNGLYTQLWALVFLPLAIGLAYRYVTTGQSLIVAIFFGFLTFGFHVIAAFILNFSVVLFCFASLSNKNFISFRRAIIYFATLALVTAHQWVFVFIDAPYINQSALEPAWKYHGRGFEYVVSLLWSGKAFDVGRFPSITILFLISICFAIFTPPQKTNQRFLKVSLYACLLFFSLYVGRQVWGWLFTDMPALKSLHIHRFSIGFHFFAIVIIGGLLAYIQEYFGNSKLKKVIFFFLLAFVLFPAFQERTNLFLKSRNLRLGSGNFVEQNKEVVDLISTSKVLSAGPIYGGANYNWGLQTTLFGIPSYFFPTAEGYTTVGGSLYHAFSLAGETLFDFNVTRKSHYELYGIKSVIAEDKWEGLVGFNQVGVSKNLSLWSTGLSTYDFGKIGFTVCGSQKSAPDFMRSWVQSRLPDLGSFGQILPGKCPKDNQNDINFTDAPPATTLDSSSIGSVLESLDSDYKAWRSKARVVMQSEGVVVLPTGYHPNWSARVDGVQVKTVWVTPGFVATVVPAGTHIVEFEYQGSVLKTVAIVLSGLFFIAIFVFNLLKRPI